MSVVKKINQVYKNKWQSFNKQQNDNLRQNKTQKNFA